MRFIIQRKNILKSLQLVIGAIERRQTMPILANVLLVVADKKLSMTCTDLEIELISNISLEYATEDAGSITVSGRKLLDICRVLPESSMVEFTQEGNQVIVRSERSKFVLVTLPAEEFPSVDWKAEDSITDFTLPQKDLLHLLNSTQFAMAQQDVRYYLNGLLLELKNSMVWAVATDGHRLALNGIMASISTTELVQVIVPRKGIIELMRLLDSAAAEVSVAIAKNHIRVVGTGFIFTSKLIDGKFPDYDKAIPKDGDKEIIIGRDIFKQALTRVAVLSGDVVRGVRLQIASGTMRMFTNSQDQEAAEEEIAIEYKGEEVTTGFNINYLLDILANSNSEKIVMKLKEGTSSALVEEHAGNSNSLYVVMPLRF